MLAKTRLVLPPIATGLLVCVVVSGCAGVLLIAQIIGWVKAGEILGLINDDNPAQYTVYIDGYSLNVTPNPNGSLNMAGMPEGIHLLSLANNSKHRGWHRQVEIVGNSSLNLGQINPFSGAVIRGRVTRDTTTDGTAAVAGALVIAVFEAPDLLDAVGGSIIDIPPPVPADPENPDVEYIAAFTDDDGRYVLGPARYGEWLVFTALEGYFADAEYANVGAGHDATGCNLHLVMDDSRTPGLVRGNVSYSGAGVAEVVAALEAPFLAQVPPTRRTAIELRCGRQLIDGPWFRLARLATLTSPAGDYGIDLPPGRQRLVAFKFNHRAQQGIANVTAGSIITLDFRLPRRD